MSSRTSRHSKPSPKMLLSEFIDYFVSLSQHDLRQTTLDRIYHPAFDSLLAICGNKPLSSYGIRDIETYKAERLKTCSPVTFNIAFRSLKAAFNQAVKWELIPENPFRKSKQVRVPEKPPVHFTREEFAKFIAAVREPTLKDLFVFAVLTGMRQGEILNMQWNDVDSDQKLIRITNQNGFLTKTGRSRAIPMNDDVCELLAGLKDQSAGCQIVFTRRGEKMKQSYVEHKFKQYVRASRLRDDLKFHSLRHYAESRTMPSGDANSSRLNPFPVVNSA